MADIRPFAALRPKAEFAPAVAALPYDVMSTEEARAMAADNPHSFLHVTRAEIGLDRLVDQYDDLVYKTAARNLNRLEAEGVLARDEKPCYYIYAQTMNGRTQTGIVAAASVQEYLDGRIKRHELTREAKERDRIRHIAATNANTGPVFLTHKPKPEITAFIKNYTTSNEPEISFTPDDGVTHTVWVVNDDESIAELRGLFAELPALYIADGHHRNESAAKVALRRREENPDAPPDAEFNFYLAAIFSGDELMIMDYNRVVATLNGLTEEEFLEEVRKAFEIGEETSYLPIKPQERHTFGMYLNKKWYTLTVKSGIADEADPVASLDCDILQRHLLAPVLGILDPRIHPDIDFIGGLRGLHALAEQVDRDGGVAFALFPTSMDELIAVADAGKIMPPKSTWFEPKLRSGLFVKTL